MKASVATSTTPLPPHLDRPSTNTVQPAPSPGPAHTAPIITVEPPGPAVTLSAAGAAGKTTSKAESSPAVSTQTTMTTTTTTTTTASSGDSTSAKSSQPPSPRVVFGSGTIARLPTELGVLRLSSPLIVSSPSRISLARRIQALIPNLDTRILDSALVNVPSRVVQDAMARISGHDCVISIGGASAVKLAKNISFRKSIPHICIPTSYSGSEMPLLGDPRRRGSKSRRSKADYGSSSSSSGGKRGDATKSESSNDHQAAPAIIIYDEDLTNISASMTISATGDFKLSPQSHRDSKGDDAQWSYIHLPGV